LLVVAEVELLVEQEALVDLVVVVLEVEILQHLLL
jgi:hypothetical protein